MTSRGTSPGMTGRGRCCWSRPLRTAMAGQARNRGGGSYQVIGHDPVAGGGDSTAVAVFTVRGIR
jgi:hypothetical protein